MQVVAFSDSHWKLDDLILPEGDVLICAGDWSVSNGGMSDLIKFSLFIKKQPHTHKIIISGNHDFIGQSEPSIVKESLKEAGAIYLSDSGVIINNTIFYGTPWCPEFMNWAFMKPDYELGRYFNRIPKETDILITHTPPYGICDSTEDGFNVGSQKLLDRVLDVKPAHHIFGHIHGCYGTEYSGNTVFHNVSVCNEKYELVNKPIVFEV